MGPLEDAPPSHDAGSDEPADTVGRRDEISQTLHLGSDPASGPVPAPPSRDPQEFGPYRLLEELGRGGQGAVYLAEDSRLGRRVALKVMEGRGGDAQALLARFRREAAIAARLNHRGICAVHDTGMAHGVPWIAMELIEGETVAARVAAACDAGESTCADVTRVLSEDDGSYPDSGQGQVTVEERDTAALRTPSNQARLRAVVLMVEKAARALHAAHEAGIVHRDVKPGNVMVTAAGRVVILDFGLARDEGSEQARLTLTGDLMGTPAYMSPEQLTRENSELDRRTDVWSLGVMLYECVTLKRPFEAPTRQGLYQQIIQKEPADARSRNPAVSRDLAVVIATALDKDPDRRYQTALDLAEDLRRIRSYEPIRARPVGSWTRLVRWSQRNPALAGTLAALIVILLAGTATTLVFGLRAAANAKEARSNERLAEANATEARKQATEARRNLEQVLRLSAFQNLEDLRRQADRLWPMHPDLVPDYEDWLEKAGALIASLDQPDPKTGSPGLREQLATLRGRARPRADEEREAERRSHPRFAELEARRAELVTFRKAQAVRAGRGKPQSFPLSDVVLAKSAGELNELAWSLVGPDRETFGREEEGLALARRAAALVEGSPRAEVLDTLAWALVANGLDSEAQAVMVRAVEAAPARRRATLEESRDRLEEFIASCSGEAGRERLAALETEVSELEHAVQTPQMFVFDSDEDRWWHTQLTMLVGEIEAFADPKTGLVHGISPEFGWGIARRLAFARTLRQRTLEDRVADWAATVIRIARNDRYQRLQLAPQLGLVPLGPDPASGLEEFAETASGEVPSRDPATGRLRITESSGIALVLIPGGTFTMGAQSEDPDAPGYFPQADADEAPLHEVTLAPYFFGKDELTQGQWQRLTGSNPSSYPAGTEFGAETVCLLNPVEQISWHDASRVLLRVGLVLPTEAQWEYACRGGTSSPWWTGSEKEALAKAGNVADAYCQQYGGPSTWSYESWDDGYVVHAPAGSFAPNPFGLYDVHGNVFEWCRDAYGDYGLPVREGDGLLRSEDPSRIIRSGSFGFPAAFARSSSRRTVEPASHYDNLGARAARAITPP